jgi:lipopolysaccharide transport system ATP-binding protein
MSNIAISAQGLGKKYRLGTQKDRYGRLTESLWNGLTAPFRPKREREAATDFWALRDISFEIPRGSAVGIIGRNGAGKSTLLKILSRITEPTLGRAELRGRVGSLLEVGTGMHPELTGRENLFLSGVILGMRGAEITQQFEEIVEFADIGPFIDTPVKRYSSGMKVRLGFAVAAFLEPEILFIDEVLAVGDAAFQKKCLGKMEDVAHRGRTVLFVSHNMASVESLCTVGLLLEGGRIVADGAVADVVDTYLDSVRDSGSGSILDRVDREGDGRLKFVRIDTSMRLGSTSEIRLQYQALEGLRNVEVSIGLFTLRGEGVLFLGNRLTEEEFNEVPRSGAIVCRLDRSTLLPGIYSMNVHCTVNGIIADWIQDAARIEVAEGDYYGTGRTPPVGYGHLLMDQRWTVEAG